MLIIAQTQSYKPFASSSVGCFEPTEWSVFNLLFSDPSIYAKRFPFSKGAADHIELLLYLRRTRNLCVYTAGIWFNGGRNLYKGVSLDPKYSINDNNSTIFGRVQRSIL